MSTDYSIKTFVLEFLLIIFVVNKQLCHTFGNSREHFTEFLNLFKNIFAIKLEQII